VVLTVVVEEEEDSSVEKKERDQEEGTVDEPVPEVAEIGLGDQAERTWAEPVREMMEDRSGKEPDLMEVEGAVGTREPVLEEAVEGTGLCLFEKQERVIFLLRVSPEMILRRWGSLQPKKPPKHHLPLFRTNLQKHPPALSRGRRALKLWLGGRIFPGSESWPRLKPKPLHLPRKLHKNNLPNQPVNPTD